MNCEKCGKLNDNDSKFCVSCGAPIATNQAKPKKSLIKRIIKIIVGLVVGFFALCILLAILGAMLPDSSNSDSANETKVVSTTKEEKQKKANPKKDEKMVREAVVSAGVRAGVGKAIGGNDIKFSEATVTNVERVTDDLYRVNGKICMTDIYGTKWENRFDCEVIRANNSWLAEPLQYKSENWIKSN